MNAYIKIYLAKNKQTLSNNYNSGFTLLEMITVVLLIGILSAIVAPGWVSFMNTRRLNIAQNQVYNAMRQAQSEAKKEKLTWQVSFREQDNIVQWAVHLASVSPSKANWNNLDSNIRLDNETTLQLSQGVRQIQFDYLGSVRKPPLGRITLSHKSGGKAKRCVFVSTILGAMRTAKEQPKANGDGDFCY
ncbi:Tfp pilus assembly protein FimT/FimU [Anabaena sp. PCC 7108]|uniref:pilus assembly FimT family protein n=1 Tax=Anabaena sp. PCC 7108 TaxID=163908 RepID=UPI00034C6D78|nr:type II secretion system protein [Anabaena sp. PCC 7108]